MRLDNEWAFASAAQPRRSLKIVQNICTVQRNARQLRSKVIRDDREPTAVRT